MKTYSTDEMKAILADHSRWLRNEAGKRADLTDADLRGTKAEAEEWQT